MHRHGHGHILDVAKTLVVIFPGTVTKSNLLLKY